MTNKTTSTLPPDSSSADEAQVVADRLHSAAIHLLRRLRRHDESTGITPSRLSALSVVVFAGPLRLGELAAAEQVRAPTMTRLVRALEDDGLVKRQVDPKDRRVFQVSATKRGRKLMQQGRKRRVAELSRAVADLDGEEREVLGRAAGILERLLSPGAGK